jgi:hypothetical protein
MCGGYSLDSSKILVGLLKAIIVAGYSSLLRLFREFVNPLNEKTPSRIRKRAGVF